MAGSAFDERGAGLGSEVRGAGLSSDGRWWWDARTWHPAFTADEQWWWDGTAWRPARTPGGRWQFTGVGWVRRPPRLTWPAWVVVLGGGWAFLLAACLPEVHLLVGPGSPAQISRARRDAVVAVLALVVVGTMLIGYLLGRRSRWLQWALCIPAGTAAVLFGYAATMVTGTSDNDPTADNAAGAGLAILAGPVFLSVAVLLALGAAPLGVQRVLALRVPGDRGGD